MHQPWLQDYNPLGNAALSTIVATIPVLLLFYLLAIRKTAAYLAAVWALVAAVLSALLLFKMPAVLVAGAVSHGLVYGVVRIAWVLLAAVFVYEITVETGYFETIKASIGSITDDRRLQVLLIAFAFGALLEGSGGGGAPVAITGAMMVGIGFNPFQTAILCLIANSAPVAYGGMGNPIRTLVAVTGLGEADLSGMVGRILPLTTLILPFYLIRIQASTRQTLQVWPGLLACGVTFGGIQFFWSNFVDASLVDIVGGMGTLLLLAVFFRVWKPREIWRYPGESARNDSAMKYTKAQVIHAWSPFLLLAVFVVVWGLPAVIRTLDQTTLKIPVPGLHQQVIRHAPVVVKDFAEPAVFDFAWLSGVGTATFFAGLLAGPLLGLTLGQTLQVFFKTLRKLRTSLIAIIAMMSLGFLTRYSGMDAVMGLAMARTGVLFPMFGTLIGWLGVALSGTDAGSNALFGSLQTMTANQLGISPVLMSAANSAGGVMGKMIAAQSLIVGCAATGQQGKEGDLFRAVFKHSLILAIFIGLIVTMYAYVFPGAIPHGHRFW
ncbi:MAG: lactate permease LctP family transporter [Bryobacterales bacterium]|nr:lactate permease LctP family transporter [Bryobacterales bacterium]